MNHCLTRFVYSVNSLWSKVALWWHNYMLQSCQVSMNFSPCILSRKLHFDLKYWNLSGFVFGKKYWKFRKFVFEASFHRLAEVMACCLTARNHVNFSLIGFCGIHLKANLHRVLQLLFCKERYLEHFWWNCPQVNAKKTSHDKSVLLWVVAWCHQK